MKSIEEKWHIIAFLDLLGASKIMESDRSQEVLVKIKEVFEFTRMIAEVEYRENISDIEVTVFSDNITFARKIPQNPEEMNDEDCMKIVQFIIFISRFLGMSIEKGLLFRGGITVGSLYVDKKMIWGKALVNAHELEEKIAIFPRIVVSKDVIRLLCRVKWNTLKRDFDGVWFVDFFDQIFRRKGELIEKIKSMAEEEKRNNAKNESILQKYEWLERYVQTVENIGNK